MEVEKRPILIIDSKVVRYKNFSIAPAPMAFGILNLRKKPIKRVTHFEIEIICSDDTELHLVRHEFEGSVRPRTERPIYSFS